jgi:hypothetical protein
MTSGPGLSARREGKASVPLRGDPGLAVGLFSGWARTAPSAFFYFFVLSFSLFLFSIFFHIFCKKAPINSNKILNSSKNQHIGLKQ